MKKVLSIFAALAALAWGPPAAAAVVCDSCSFLSGGGTVASFLGEHNTLTSDNSTFSNSTTGTNGSFTNWWIFRIDPAGLASINAIFLPIQNIDNFDVDLFGLGGATCAANGPSLAGACSAYGLGAQIADGNTVPDWATVIDFTFLNAGFYAFRVSGDIAGLGLTQPASYVGNLQVQAQAVPEPGALALAGLGLVGLGAITRRKGS